MTLEQMRELLATVASYDGRTVDRRVIEDWHALAGSMPLDLALAAVRHWYTFHRGYMQPHDLAASAVTISGMDKPDSVTARRLEGLQLAHELTDSKLAAPMQLERTGNDEA